MARTLSTAAAPPAEDPRARVCRLPDDANIDVREVAAFLGVSSRQVDRLVRRGVIPKPIPNLGTQVRRWQLGRVRKAVEALQSP